MCSIIRIVVAVVTLAVFGVPQSAWAQVNLAKWGNTALQKQNGQSISNTCFGFVQDSNKPDPNSQSGRLFSTCGKMVNSGNDLDGKETGVALSLKLSKDQMAGAYQQIATEEFAATESMATEISTNRSDAVINRLSAIRAGVAGFSVSGFQPQTEQGEVADNGWLPTDADKRGGSAGDDGPGSALSGFLNINYGFGNRDGTEDTNEFDYNSYNLTLGVDYRFTNNLVVGGALTYFKIDSEFEAQSASVNNPNASGGTAVASTVSGGETEADGFGGIVYATWYGDHFYVDGLAGYAVSSYDLQRSIFIPSESDIAGVSETAKASPDGKDVSLSLGAGYTWNPGAISWGPYLRLNYLNVDIESYDESGADVSGLNLRVDGQDWTSLTSVLGGSFSWAISSGFAVIVPQARLGWVHQFENDETLISATYVADPRNNTLLASTGEPEKDYAELGLAISGVFQGGGQVFFSYDTLLGFENLTSHLFTLGGRLEF